MKASLESMEMTYEATFSVPLFDLPGRSTELLKSLYRSIHPRFALQTTDMYAFGGNALSEACVRLNLFAGNGTIEVTADRLSMRFTGLRQEQDVNICNECIALAEQALRSALPEAVVGRVMIRQAPSLRLGDGTTDARNYLRRVVKPGVDVELNGLGNATMCPGINVEVENEEEGWWAVLYAYAGEKSSITVPCTIAYADFPEDRPGEERTDRLQRLLRGLLRGLDLEILPPDNEPAS